MNAQAAYIIVTTRMQSFQAEADHDRLAREASADRQGVLKRIASSIHRRMAQGFDDVIAEPALPALSDYPYRSWSLSAGIDRPAPAVAARRAPRPPSTPAV